MVRQTFPDKPYYLLETPDIRQAAEADPKGFLDQTPDGAILGEIQRVPLLLSYIQGIVDAEQQPGMFIITGSHQPDLHQTVNQSPKAALFNMAARSVNKVGVWFE